MSEELLEGWKNINDETKEKVLNILELIICFPYLLYKILKSIGVEFDE